VESSRLDGELGCETREKITDDEPCSEASTEQRGNRMELHLGQTFRPKLGSSLPIFEWPLAWLSKRALSYCN